MSIFQFDSKDSLILVLAHELGHSLGMEHVENPKSLMYPVLGLQKNEPNLLTKEDLTEFMDVCPSLDLK